MGTPRAVRPFRTGQYRILFGAVLLSLLGTGVWAVASVFQVRELGGGPVELSWVATGNAIGLILAVLLGGALADRVPQKLILAGVEITRITVAATTAVLSLTGVLELWHLAALSLVLGLVDGFFYPAYSAMLPSILPADDLLAANGVEGALRPTVMNAAGPALAALALAALSPGWAFAIVAVSQLVGLALLSTLRRTEVRRDLAAEDRHPVAAMLADIWQGIRYVAVTPWLAATLVFASIMVLVMMGPLEVLLPFVVFDNTGGGAAEFALVLAAFGIGGAVGSLLTGSLRLPRRYLTIMNLLWAVGCLPFVAIGFTDQLWVIVAGAATVGYLFNSGGVIWGTLLQRRVPPELLGRVSSLDFFVSLLFMPVSMALAGPVGAAIGYAPAFLIAGLVPLVVGVAAILIARMPRDELEHPLDPAAEGDVLGATELLEEG